MMESDFVGVQSSSDSKRKVVEQAQPSATKRMRPSTENMGDARAAAATVCNDFNPGSGAISTTGTSQQFTRSRDTAALMTANDGGSTSEGEQGAGPTVQSSTTDWLRVDEKADTGCGINFASGAMAATAQVLHIPSCDQVGGAPPPVPPIPLPENPVIPPNHPMPTEDIVRVISERELARSARNWAQADQLREQLRACGVQVYDRDKEWRSDDGRSGYISVMGGSTAVCSLSNEDILSMLDKRELARVARDYSSADAVRLELRAHGVEVFDKQMMWRANDGRQGRISAQLSVVRLPPPVTHEIDSLLFQREEARAKKDWGTADTLRQSLRDHGIELHENIGAWRSSDGRVGLMPQPNNMTHVQSLSEGAITMMLDARETARRSRDFELADSYREKLRSRGVEIYDKNGSWSSADGRSGTIGVGGHGAQVTSFGSGSAAWGYSGFGGQTRQQTPHTRQGYNGHNNEQRPRTSLPLEHQTQDSDIMQMLQLREQHRHAKDYVQADAIRDQLRAYGVTVFDRDGRWESSDGRRGMIPSVYGQ